MPTYRFVTPAQHFFIENCSIAMIRAVDRPGLVDFGDTRLAFPEKGAEALDNWFEVLFVESASVSEDQSKGAGIIQIRRCRTLVAFYR